MKVAVFSLWRNSEPYIKRSLKQFEDLESIENIEWSFFFYENDSTDNTVEILKDWLKTRSGELLHETLRTKHYGSVMDVNRMKLLASYRNKCKELANNQSFDFAVVVDSDVIFSAENFKHGLKFLQTNEFFVMTTANVRQPLPDVVFGHEEDSYYDVGCLRDKYGNETLYCSGCPFKRIEDRMLWRFNQAVEINSGFGGFAVIRWEPFSLVKWSADLNIEHVNFCYDLKSFGKICVLPYSKVYVDLKLPPNYLDSCMEQLKKQQYEI